MVKVQHDAELADPLVEVRDVVESYRCCGVTPTDWGQTLGHAITALDQLPQEAGVEFHLPDLVSHLRILLTEGLDRATKVVAEVAAQVAIALSQARIPGIPRPDEDDWEFSQPPTAS
jgi:hypothetical protein